jgi:hypothetical protein
MLGGAAALLLSGSVSAGPIPGSVAVEVLINGQQVGDDVILEADENGDFSLDERLTFTSGEVTAALNAAEGNTDPFIIFGVGLTNNSDVNATVAFAFSIPIDLIGTVIAHAEVGYSLTDGEDDGATVFITSGTGFVVDSQDILDTLDSVDKGVDVGDRCDIDGPPSTQNCPLGAPEAYVADNIFDLPSQAVTMSVIVAFGLTPHDAVGMSGVVRQEAPEPGTLLLLGTGIVGLALVGRRR